MNNTNMFDERYYSFDSYIDLTPCDYISIDAGLNNILEENLHLGYVDEDYNNLLNAAADLSDQLYRVIDEFSDDLPQRNVQDDPRGSGIYWFDSAIALYNGTDMDELMANEDKYNPNDYNEKSLRLRAVNSLTKEQHLLLLSNTYAIVFRYIQLKTEVSSLIGINDELNRLHSMRKKNDSHELPKSAWV